MMTNDTKATGEVLTASASPALTGAVVVPGDKSISHRAIILAALAEGESRIEGLLESEDVLHTVAAARLFGADVERREDGSWIVRGRRWRSPIHAIDCGNSGTGVRLLMGAAAGAQVRATFKGDASLSSRPMKRVTGPLGLMGARFEGDDRLPLTLATGVTGGIRYLNEKASAQVKSAILLAGLGTDAAVEVIEPRASRDHSERMLTAFGADVISEQKADGLHVRLGEKRSLSACDIDVPADPSSAAFMIVAALVVPGSQVTAHGVLMNPLRTGLFASLEEMGADLTYSNRRLVGGEEVADITARHSALKGVEVPAQRAPSMIDEYPILAIAAAFADGRSIFHGLAELRVKESDRLALIVSGLIANGVDAHEQGDAIVIDGNGRVAGGALVPSHGDHRIAMSFLVAGLASNAPIAVDQAEMIATSFPGFAPLIGSLGAKISRG